MISKTEQLNNLFEEWKQFYPDYNKSFVEDGIVNEEMFKAQKMKLLFVGKEVNDADAKSWDYRKHLNETLKYRYNRNIARWAYGILNNFPAYDDLKNQNLHDTIRSIAIIEAKKFGGGGKCDNVSLKQNIFQNQLFLGRQIDIIKPDIIISGLFEKDLVTTLFPGISFEKAGYDRCVATWNNYRIIDFYHPSNQSSSVAMYVLLEKIFKSQAFQQLGLGCL